MKKEEAYNILSQFINPKEIFINDQGEEDALIDIPTTAVMFVYDGIFESNIKAQSLLKELINCGNPLVNFEQAIEEAQKDKEMLLKCHSWTVKGLKKKADTVFNKLPDT